MYKPRTIPQFKVMEFLKENFVTDACLIWPISRDALALEDRDEDRIGFVCRQDLISECGLPAPGNREAVKMFLEDFNEAYPQSEDQTFEHRTQQWLKRTRLLTYQQALGLSDELFRHYLSHPMLTELDVLLLISKGMVTPEEYRAIQLWYLDGHQTNNHLCIAGVDGDGPCAELTFHYGRPCALRRRFRLNG